jgi:hypothetical protein
MFPHNALMLQGFNMFRTTFEAHDGGIPLKKKAPHDGK